MTIEWTPSPSAWKIHGVGGLAVSSPTKSLSPGLPVVGGAIVFALENVETKQVARYSAAGLGVSRAISVGSLFGGRGWEYSLGDVFKTSGSRILDYRPIRGRALESADFEGFLMVASAQKRNGAVLGVAGSVGYLQFCRTPPIFPLPGAVDVTAQLPFLSSITVKAAGVFASSSVGADACLSLGFSAMVYYATVLRVDASSPGPGASR